MFVPRKLDEQELELIAGDLDFAARVFEERVKVIIRQERRDCDAEAECRGDEASAIPPVIALGASSSEPPRRPKE